LPPRCPSLSRSAVFAPSLHDALPLSLVMDARFATPESTMTTSVIAPPLLPERAFGGGHVVEAGAGHRLLQREGGRLERRLGAVVDRKSTRLNSSHGSISYAVFCLKTK